MNLLLEWEAIELEQALSLLGGYFSLNSDYQSNCVISPPHPLKEEHVKRFRKIRNVAIQCLKSISVERLDLISL